MTEKDFLVALKEAVSRAGTQGNLAKTAGISQGRISDYLNGRYAIGNMTISVLLKIFADMKIDFFGGTSGDGTADAIFEQVRKIFYSLDAKEQARLGIVVAANFGEKIREETKR